MAEPLKEEYPEFEVPEMPAVVSPQFPSSNCEPPLQYEPQSTDTVVDRGLQFSQEYGLSGPTEGLDLTFFDYLGDSFAMGLLTDRYDDSIGQLGQPWVDAYSQVCLGESSS